MSWETAVDYAAERSRRTPYRYCVVSGEDGFDVMQYRRPARFRDQVCAVFEAGVRVTS